jgi:hypothetical protein
MHWRIATILIFCLSALQLSAQEDDAARQVLENILEELAQTSEEGVDLSQAAEDLEYYLQNPLNLNTATYDELARIPILNEFQIAKLLEYINRQGPMFTLYELRLIEGFEMTDITRLLPFVTLSAENREKSWQLSKALSYGKNDLFARTAFYTEKMEGYQDVSDSVRQANPEKYYPGNSMRLYSRYAFNYNNQLQAGITTEKDPGEQFFKGHQQKGFDYYSAFIEVNDIGKVKTLIIGDFQAKFGQGLVSWSALGTGKSAYVLDIRKKGDGLKKYSSTDENLFFRGAATTLKFGQLVDNWKPRFLVRTIPLMPTPQPLIPWL